MAETELAKYGAAEQGATLPPVLAGSMTPEVQWRVGKFYSSIAAIFEAWVARRKSVHTRRAYRGDVMAFVKFMNWHWPEDSLQLLQVSIRDIQAFKADIENRGGAGKTVNRRVSSLSSFYKYLAATAAELRLPVTVPNPAHAQFIARESSDPVQETRALSINRARQLLSMPAGNSLFDIRDRAILKFYLYSGARLATGCTLRVTDFHRDGDEASIRVQLKGGRIQTKGLHVAAAESIAEYIEAAGLSAGPLFRPRRSPKSTELADRAMTARTMNRLLMRYLKRLPGAEQDGGFLYSPHSLRATSATLLLDAGVPIEAVQDLLDHKHITTTQIYDKRRRSVRDSASHKMPV